jgi:hypothetical protein
MHLIRATNSYCASVQEVEKLAFRRPECHRFLPALQECHRSDFEWCTSGENVKASIEISFFLGADALRKPYLDSPI